MDVPEVEVEEVSERAEAGALLVDVREPDEYEAGALPGAIHIPRGHLESQVESRLTDKESPVVVYCAGGYRSSVAASLLRPAGIADIDGVKLDVVTQGEFIAKGTQIRVIKVEGRRIVVEAVRDEAAEG